MNINYIIGISLISLIFGSPEPQTGWFFEQTTQQSFYLFDDITIDGDSVVGDGSGESDGECFESGNCDVVGAFRRGVCSDPTYQWSELLCTVLGNEWNIDEEICVGWRYADSNGATTVPLMGREGDEGTDSYTYMNVDEVPYIKIYDASNGSILDLTPSTDLPGWELNSIFTIDGTSTANNILGCTDFDACNYDDSATGDDGSCLWNDCTGECGGSAEEDECGVCNGDGSSCAGVDGCIDNSACNYNPEATDDDGSCEYAMENYDCDGNCTASEDCNGECGGSAVVDECGVCEGTGIADGDCDCDGNVDLGCGCGEAGPSGCDNACGSTLENDECGV